jgi:hypothetical protein
MALWQKMIWGPEGFPDESKKNLRIAPVTTDFALQHLRLVFYSNPNRK